MKPPINSIYQMFLRRVEESPSAPAVDDAGRIFTYADLNRLADAIRARFPERRPLRVGVVMNHTAEMIGAMLAVIKAGGAYVAAEPTFPEERVRFMMRQSRVDFIITNPEYAGLFESHRLLTLTPGKVNYTEATPTDVVAISGDAPAYILYTSGTSGNPKGVVVTNANVCHYARAFRNEFHNGPGDVMLQSSVCTFDIFVEEVFATLLNGATLCIAPEVVKADARQLLAYAGEHGVTMISGFPYLLLDFNKIGALPPTVRLLISGGDVLRASYVDRLIDKVEVYNTYGPSETTVCASYYRCNCSEPLPDGTYPVGKAVEGADVEILDDMLRPVHDGDVGEICIFGDGVSKGYLVRNHESDNFTRMPDGRRVYRSGDLGRKLPDGNIAFLHRKDSQVMILGKRVECEEVESVLCACDEVERGVVCPYTDAHGLSYLAAYIVPKAGKLFSLHRLKEKMRRYLTSFMIPEYFVAMAAIPLTPNGKVDRDALPVVLKEGDVS